MAERTLRRLWTEEAACGFCLRAEPGGVWCSGMCRNLSLADVVKRVRTLRNNVVRLEAVRHGPVKAIRPHAVPCASMTPHDHAAQQRSRAVEHIIESLQRLQAAPTMAEATAQRLCATRKALVATQAALAKNRSTPDRR